MLDLSSLFQQYKAKWYLFVISVACCLAMALFWTRIKPTVYSVTSNVLIDAEGNDPLASLGFASLFGSGSSVDDEIFVLSSHSLYGEVAKELGLDRRRVNRPAFMQKIVMYENYPLDIIPPAQFADTTRMSLTFNVKVNPEGLARIKATDNYDNRIVDLKDAPLPAKVNTPYGVFEIVKTSAFVPGEKYKYRLITQGYDKAAEELDEDVEALIANKRTNVITLAYDTSNPEFGKKLLNTIMSKYDERVINNKNQQSNQTLQFLDNRLGEVADGLSNLESRIQGFKEGNSLVDVEADVQYNFAMKGELAKKLVEAESQLELAGMAREFMSTPGNEYSLIPFAPTADGTGSGLNAMIEAYNKLAVERVQILSNAKEGNVQVRNVDRQMDAMRSNIVESLNKNYQNSRVIVGDLRSKMNQAESKLGAMPRQERQMVDLKRDQMMQSSLYTILMQRREETSVMLANAVSKGTVVDPAFVLSEPVSMSKKKVLAFALILGLILPIVFLFMRKVFRGRPESREEFENQSEAPILGEIATSRSHQNLVVRPNSISSTAELFKLVRTNLMFMLRGWDHPVIMVTSSRPGEGKSFISINLASTFALQGKRVLLVGLDIRKPMLAEYLGLPLDNPGLTNFLSIPTMKFQDVVQHVKEVPGMDVVVAGVIPPNPAELLLDPRLKTFFDDAREEYDYVIVDSAPVGMVSDSLAVAEIAAATIYVTRLGVTTNRDIQFINGLFHDERLPRMSVIVNGTRSVKGYGYGYGSVEDHGKNVTTRRKGLFGRIFKK